MPRSKANCTTARLPIGAMLKNSGLPFARSRINLRTCTLKLCSYSSRPPSVEPNLFLFGVRLINQLDAKVLGFCCSVISIAGIVGALLLLVVTTRANGMPFRALLGSLHLSVLGFRSAGHVRFDHTTVRRLFAMQLAVRQRYGIGPLQRGVLLAQLFGFDGSRLKLPGALLKTKTELGSSGNSRQS